MAAVPAWRLAWAGPPARAAPLAWAEPPAWADSPAWAESLVRAGLRRPAEQRVPVGQPALRRLVRPPAAAQSRAMARPRRPGSWRRRGRAGRAGRGGG